MAIPSRLSRLPVHQLGISHAFESLSAKEKLYAHHLARAAWHGARIILRQVSPESIDIFDFILELHSNCSGDWGVFVSEGYITRPQCDAFLDYAATFLSNIGNYHGSGDQKITPTVSPVVFEKLSKRSPKLESLYRSISPAVFSKPPYGLGLPSSNAQTTYYEGDPFITKEKIEAISRILEEHSISPENTRIRRVPYANAVLYEVLQASVEEDDQPREFQVDILDVPTTIRIVRGDHSEELTKICECLADAKKYAASENQELFLAKYIESFKTGDLEAYRESQRTWLADKSPRVENIFGFVEPYRDPCGVRAEFEGIVAIKDPEETRLLRKLVIRSNTFIKRLPWAGGSENGGKGPFEKELFDSHNFTSIHSLAYCSSIIFPGINLPNYNDLRDQCGFKNVIIANRMAAESNATQLCPFVDASELDAFHKTKFTAYYWWVVLHELLGHGTSKLLQEGPEGVYNFDIKNPPVNPLTGEPITSWYKPGQTWTGQFGDLATTVDECRAELVGAYLMDDVDLLKLLGHNENTEISAADLTYNLYMQLGVEGLQGLANFNVETGKWGQAHSRAHFAILKTLLTDSSSCLTITHTPSSSPSSPPTLTVHVDRSKILSHGKPALGRMLLRLHMYRVTADVAACRDYYEELSKVDGEYLAWREVVLAERKPNWVFVQANTFERDGEVVCKEYEASARGVVASWAERGV